MSELLPCPFCGGEAELKRYQSGDWQVICYHTDGCIMLESDLDNCYWENVQTLVRQWNSRAERTCEFAPDGMMDDRLWFSCSRCGGYITTDYGMPKYCPHCGCKVVNK